MTYKTTYIKRSLILLVCSLLIGCRSAPPVQISPDTYIISKSSAAGAFTNMAKLRSDVVQEANDFAAGQGKIAVGIKGTETVPRVGFPSYEYRFKLMDPGDPRASEVEFESTSFHEQEQFRANPSGAPGSALLAGLNNAWVVAQDGTPLGKITTNKFDPDSIINEFGTYGNRFNSSSIHNEFGKYGSQYSQYSAFNEFASEPPLIVDTNGAFIGYLSKNLAKQPSIDPAVLIAMLKGS